MQTWAKELKTPQTIGEFLELIAFENFQLGGKPVEKGTQGAIEWVRADGAWVTFYYTSGYLTKEELKQKTRAFGWTSKGGGSEYEVATIWPWR